MSDNTDGLSLYPRRDELAAALSQLSSATVGVVGDFCLDHYLFIDSDLSEVSIETGRTTSPVGTFASSPGGAANLAANLAGLGVGRVVAFGVVGADFYGRQLRGVLEEARVDTGRLADQPDGWDTQVYMKVIQDRRERDRFDFGVHNRLGQASMDAVIASVEAEMPHLDALLINQQLRTGVHTNEFRRRLRTLLRGRRPSLVLIDSRDFCDELDFGLRKLNAHEAARTCGEQRPTDSVIPIDGSLEHAGRLRKRWSTTVVVTLGEEGCLVADADRVTHVPGIHHIVELDTVGAGDAMLAGLTAGLLSGLPAPTAALIGNITAGVTVRTLFRTGTASAVDVIALAADPDYRYNPQARSSSWRRRYRNDGLVEVVENRPPADIRYAVFDHDGTISTIRQGWEPVMLRTMVDAILGDATAGRGGESGRAVSSETRHEVEQACREFIETTTGVQTLVQMDGLRSLVRRFGLVPEAEILSAQGYKDVYNAELMRFVDDRLAAFRAGRLSTAELTIQNAVAFLQALADAGVVLYLASGTDVDDVRREASALGYAELFGDRIFGATGDVRAEPKKLALRAIMEDIGLSGAGAVATFGDGPVEMRETRKVGGYCVGVASDEVRRYGWNEAKRDRLVTAGAHILVSDFGRYRELAAYLLGDRT